MVLVGVTGGIGSGKSSVAARLATHGWPVVDADAVAREVVEPGEPALDDLVARFGPDILLPDGALNRPGLARLAFASDEARGDLDAITHPRIAARIAARLDALRGDPAVSVGVLDHPLLIETGQTDAVDIVVAVVAPEEVRVARLVARGLDEADARARLRAQTDDATRRRVADHVLVNDGSLDDLHAAVDAIAARIDHDLVAAERGHLGGSNP